jgi:LmbE family N-acetylglucosaminyl deacetylase
VIDGSAVRKRVAALVAHPDDETLWAGGTLLAHTDWEIFIGTLCRADDADRSRKFFDVALRLSATGAMADLDDGPEQTPLADEQVRQTLLSLLPRAAFDLVLTHAPVGEYTRHRRHEEVSCAVLGLWAAGDLQASELWLFAYEDSGGTELPTAVSAADLAFDLPEEIWQRKRQLITELYGFGGESWEARVTPRREAFWRLTNPADARLWLAKAKAMT